MSKLRTIFRVILCVISGIFFNAIALGSFAKMDDDFSTENKWMVFAVFFGIICVVQLIHILITPFRLWRRDTGIMLLVVATLDAFAMYNIATIQASPEIMEQIQDSESLLKMNDYLSGGLCLLIMASIGGLLLYSSRIGKSVEA